MGLLEEEGRQAESKPSCARQRDLERKDGEGQMKRRISPNGKGGLKRKADGKRKADSSERLEKELCRVLEGPLLPYEKVIEACGKLSDELSGALDGGDRGWIKRAWPGSPASGGLTADSAMTGGQDGRILDDRMAVEQILGGSIGAEEVRLAARQISRAVLSARVRRELGEDPAEDRKRFPLGVLFHLGAGNAAGLGAYSVIEGLLAGNVNLLKPSSADRGVSSFLLKELVRLEPELAPYIHVFPIASDRQETIRRLAEMADGVVVWGSDETVRQVRAIVGPDKRLIEWGDRFSFVYCTEQGLEDREKVRELALHIVRTQQRFCSSCQAVFVDTDRQGAAEETASMLREEIDRLQAELGWDMGQVAQATLREHTFALEDALRGAGDGAPCGDRHRSGRVDGYGDGSMAGDTGGRPRAGGMAGDIGGRPRAGGCPVSCMPRASLIRELRKIPLSLQTAGLVCKEEEWEELSYRLLKAGAVRVKRPGEMTADGQQRYGAERGQKLQLGQRPTCGYGAERGQELQHGHRLERSQESQQGCELEHSQKLQSGSDPAEEPGIGAHDGVYPLLRYTKVVERR